MYKPNLPALYPKKINTLRPIRPTLINEWKVVKDRHRPHLLIYHIAPIPNIKWLYGELGHDTGVCRCVALASIYSAFKPGAGRAIRHRNGSIAPAIKVRVASSLDHRARILRRGLNGTPVLFKVPVERGCGVEEPVACVAYYGLNLGNFIAGWGEHKSCGDYVWVWVYSGSYLDKGGTGGCVVDSVEYIPEHILGKQRL